MSWYYGSDTNNGLPFPSCTSDAHNFYIGRLGGETTGGGGDFDISAANAALPPYTLGYWDLAGPVSGGSYTPDQWGDVQAQAFVKAWQTGEYESYLGGTTFFLDIEPGNGGWGTNVADNQQLLVGALAYLSGVSSMIGEEAYPGIYISQDNWDQFFGSSFNPGYGFVLWLAGTNGPTCIQAQTDFGSKPALGGYKTMLWQYAVPNAGSSNQDLDISPYEGYALNHTWKPVPA